MSIKDTTDAKKIGEDFAKELGKSAADARTHDSC